MEEVAPGSFLPGPHFSAVSESAEHKDSAHVFPDGGHSHGGRGHAQHRHRAEG